MTERRIDQLYDDDVERGCMMIATKTILEAIAKAGSDGLTERSLSSVIGADASVAVACEQLMANGEVVRRGAGSDGEPYTYHLPDGGVPRL